MAKYGYVRVSTRDQKTDRQMDALIGYGVSEKNIYVDQLSGKDFERPEYKRLLRRLKKGDVVVIKSIDRLGRNYSEILEQWRLISKDKEAYIEVLDDCVIIGLNRKSLINSKVSRCDPIILTRERVA